MHKLCSAYYAHRSPPSAGGIFTGLAKAALELNLKVCSRIAVASFAHLYFKILKSGLQTLPNLPAHFPPFSTLDCRGGAMGGGQRGQKLPKDFKKGKIRKCVVFSLAFLWSLTRNYML